MGCITIPVFSPGRVLTRHTRQTPAVPRTIRIAIPPATRDRAPGGVIDDVVAAAAIHEAFQAQRLPHSIKNFLKRWCRSGSSTVPAGYAGGPFTIEVPPGGSSGRASAV